MKTTEYLLIHPATKCGKKKNISFERSVYEPEVTRILKSGIPLGSFRLLPYSTGDVYFYDFELFPEYRYKGIGTAIFPTIIDYLSRLGYSNIRLQVSSSNPAALALYLGQGFSILESVSL